MRKAFVIMIAAILIFGASGCESLRAEYRALPAPDAEEALTPDAEVSPAQDGPSKADIENAGNIATAIIAYNCLNPDSVLPDDITLEGVKDTLGEQLWPAGLSDEEARKAWKLIVYKDGIAEVTPEAVEAGKAMQASEEEQEQAADEKTSTLENASDIAIAINAYTYLSPNASPLPGDITMEEAKETIGEWLWPEGLPEEDERAAWELIEIKDGIATVKGEG